MNPEEAIRLVKIFEDTAVSYCDAVNSTGGRYKTAQRRYERATKKLLTALLGRKPTIEEINEVLNG